MSLTKRSYSKKNDWSEITKFNLDNSYVHYTWEPMMQILFEDKERKNRIEEKINEIIKDSPDRLYPKPDYIFRAFQITSLKRTKVVFIGQDPYLALAYPALRYGARNMALSKALQRGLTKQPRQMPRGTTGAIAGALSAPEQE